MRHLILITIYLIAALSVSAKDVYTFKPMTSNNSIPDKYVHTIMQDYTGFIWVVSRDGLNRYDGYEQKHYQLPGEPYETYLLREDSEKTMWIITESKTFVYDREHDCISENICTHLMESTGIDSLKIVTVDYEGNIWYGKMGHLVHFDRYAGKKTVYKNISVDKIKSLECRGGTAYILFSDGSLITIDTINHAAADLMKLKLSDHRHHRLYLDCSLTVWLYSPHSSNDELRYYDAKGKKVANFLDGNGNTCTFVTAILDDGKGNLWIGSDNAGVLIYSKQNGRIQRIQYDSRNIFSLPSDHVNCLFLDCQNNMWVGTTKRGIAFTNLNDIEFSRHTLSPHDDINSIIEDNNGNLWFGTDGNGIYKSHVATKQSISFNEQNGEFPGRLVTCSCVDSKGRLWFGTYGSGVICRENDTNRSFGHMVNGSDMLKEVRCIEEDSFGNIWIGSIVNGLFCIEKDGDITEYTESNTGLGSNSITYMHCRDSQQLYVMTTNGPAVMDTYTRQVKALSENSVINDELNLFSTCIYQDSRGFIWLGGMDRLGVYDPRTDRLVNLSARYGKRQDDVVAICEDLNRNIWVSTDVGLSNVIVGIDPNTNGMILRRQDYTGLDGIGSIAFNPQSICMRHDGEMIVGGIGGYVSFRPSVMNLPPAPVKVLFTSLLVDNIPVGVGDDVNGRIILDRNIQLLDELTLDYSQNSFSLNVSPLDYNHLHKMAMAYRLRDTDEWIEFVGNKIPFTNLAPGSYDLQVKVYGDNPDTAGVSNLKINILPPVWMSPAAYLIYVLIILCAIGGIVIYMRRKAKSKLRMKEMEMNIIKQKELEDSQMQFFTNISHDLRTPLSLIILPLAKMLTSNNLDARTREQLTMMHRNAEILLSEVNQLLDLRKLDKGKAELKATTGNLVAFVRDICSTFEPYSNNMSVNLNLRLPDTPVLMAFDRNKMQRILMNLLSNAYKFNQENGLITVEVEKITISDNDMVQIKVSDTGIGISEHGKNHVFERFYQETHKADYIGSGIGLHIVREYVGLHGGKIEVSDNHPCGTIFTITLPIVNSGTEIENPKDESDTHNTSAEMKSDGELPILIVDDNDDFRQFIVSCLKDNYRVISATNGREALDIMKSQPVKMVISDVMMPVMDGLELCNKIKSDISTSHIPVILLTAKAADEHILTGLKEGADEYITKPFNLEILLLRISHLLMKQESNMQKFKIVEVDPHEITISSLDEQLISKAIDTVEANMDNGEFSVEQLGDSIGLSRSHLYRKTMAITGMTPLEFIRSIRIKRGKQLLEQGQYPVSEVAFMVGLSPKQFSKYFKEIFGELPSNFKRKI